MAQTTSFQLDAFHKAWQSVPSDEKRTAAIAVVSSFSADNVADVVREVFTPGEIAQLAALLIVGEDT